MPPPPRPFALLAELTYRCPLKCPYCSNPLELDRYRRELDTETWLRVLGEAAELGVIQVHFSGGEPLLRGDLAQLVAQARRSDLYSNVSTGATLASEARLEELHRAGLDALQISVLDSTAQGNDWLAGVPSFVQKHAAILAAGRVDLPVTLNIVLHRHNLDHVERMIELAEEWGVHRLELANAQYAGWAFRNRAALMPTREQVERARDVVERATSRLQDRLEILHVLPDYFERYPKACLHGWGRAFLTVAPDGAVLPCQTAREIPALDFPNIQDQSLDEIWFRAPVFNRFRGTQWMPEPCRSCERREIDFGGCRCQAFLLTSDLSATDPVCHLSPDHHVVESALRDSRTGALPLVYRSSGGVKRRSSDPQGPRQSGPSATGP